MGDGDCRSLSHQGTVLEGYDCGTGGAYLSSLRIIGIVCQLLTYCSATCSSLFQVTVRIIARYDKPAGRTKGLIGVRDVQNQSLHPSSMLRIPIGSQNIPSQKLRKPAKLSLISLPLSPGNTVSPTKFGSLKVADHTIAYLHVGNLSAFTRNIPRLKRLILSAQRLRPAGYNQRLQDEIIGALEV